MLTEALTENTLSTICRGRTFATIFANCVGSLVAHVLSACLPCSCHASCKSDRKSSPSLLREPFGLPFGLLDCQGLKRVSCFAPVVSAAPSVSRWYSMTLASLGIDSSRLLDLCFHGNLNTGGQSITHFAVYRSVFYSTASVGPMLL